MLVVLLLIFYNKVNGAIYWVRLPLHQMHSNRILMVNCNTINFLQNWKVFNFVRNLIFLGVPTKWSFWMRTPHRKKQMFFNYIGLSTDRYQLNKINVLSTLSSQRKTIRAFFIGEKKNEEKRLLIFWLVTTNLLMLICYQNLEIYFSQ